jgi:ABC-2 type transport system ATP-binding protein/sodium transport system ATP-binding protein
MIRVCGLTKRFGSPPEEITAVNELSFEVASGEVYGLLGMNGAGKTTTLRMILGLVEPTSGYAEVEGFRSSTAPDEVKCRVGLVSTSAGLYQWLTPHEILCFFADLYGLSHQLAQRNIERLVSLFDLQTFLHRRCSTLSTGQKQRVNLARSLVHDPPIILLDEPTRGLDVLGCQIVFDFLATLRTEQKSVILCTHRVDEAERVCDRIGLMHQGRFVHEGTLPELRSATQCATVAEMFRVIFRNEPVGDDTAL